MENMTAAQPDGHFHIIYGCLMYSREMMIAVEKQARFYHGNLQTGK